MTRQDAIDKVYGMSGTKEQHEALEFLIPEVRELREFYERQQEDERIRSGLVRYLESDRDCQPCQDILFYEEAIAWLKKQKDLDKMIVVSPEVWDKAIADAYENGKKDGEKQKEQKPADQGAKGRRGRIGTTPEHIRKKAENFLSKMEPPYDADDICSAYETGAMEKTNPSWSEEDKTIINCAVEIVEKAGLPSLAASLKSLRPQPKAELTLLDKNIIEAAVAFVEQNNHFSYWGGIDKHTVIKALRSLKPYWKPSEQEKSALRTAICVLTEERNFPKTAEQLQAILDAFDGKESRKDWKPSEEQTEALQTAYEYLSTGSSPENIRLSDNLRRLFNQLKKL